MSAYENPTQIFADSASEEKGENARLSAFVGAIAVGDLVKSTLGPKGMDKILQSASTGEIMVTNDGATILKSIAFDNAAAKVFVNISKVQDDEVGDGTTSSHSPGRRTTTRSRTTGKQAHPPPDHHRGVPPRQRRRPLRTRKSRCEQQRLAPTYSRKTPRHSPHHPLEQSPLSRPRSIRPSSQSPQSSV